MFVQPILVVLASVLVRVAAQGSGRCFITNDWNVSNFVPGEPNVLIWELGGANRDVLLSKQLGSQAQYLGVIARNVSQGSVFWIPPTDINEGNSNQQFSIQLWNLDNGNGCSSPAFEFAAVNESNSQNAATLPFGPFVTTALSILNTGYVTVTATVATYQTDQAQFQQAVTGRITETDGATSSVAASTSLPTSSSVPSDGDASSGPNKLAIIIGTIGGVLVLALIVLSVLLWRARRRRANDKSREDAMPDPKEFSPSSTPESQTRNLLDDPRDISTPAEVSGETARHEMMGSSHAPQELPSENMEPVELPADEIPPPSYPGHWGSEVSPTTGDSRRSSLSFDQGTFTVSPLSDRKDRKE